MITSKIFHLLCALFLTINFLKAGDNMNNILTSQEESIVNIAKYTAKGDIEELRTALNGGLDSGLTVNEIKEILTQLYAYCGFPRSLNALNCFMSVVNERQTSGIKDEQGALPSPRSDASSLVIGAANQTKLCGGPVSGALFDFAPAIDEYLKAHLFGDIFSRDNLDWQTREVATIAALAAMTGVESQLNSHIAIGRHNGLSDSQIEKILAIVSDNPCGVPAISSFPVGSENTAYAQYFSGKSYLAPITKDSSLGVPIANVTFAPGCRNNWHSHTGGQILIAVGGIGYYQERGKDAIRMQPGDIVEIPADVEHWHGAAPDSWFSHLAIECNPKANKNTWLEPVGDEDYQNATGEQ